jgi:hypothetical protein
VKKLTLILLVMGGLLITGCGKKTVSNTTITSQGETSATTAASNQSATSVSASTTTTKKGLSGEIPTPTTKPVIGPNDQVELPGSIASASGNLVVVAPQKGEKIKSPVEVKGSARVYQNKVYLRLKDKNGGLLAETQVEATMESGPITGTMFGHYTANMDFNPTTDSGSIEVFGKNEQGQETDMVTVLVKF